MSHDEQPVELFNEYFHIDNGGLTISANSWGRVDFKLNSYGQEAKISMVWMGDYAKFLNEIGTLFISASKKVQEDSV